MIRILLLFIFIAVQNLSFASFPVSESNVSIPVINDIVIGDGDKSANKSLKLSIIATLLLLLAIIFPGYSKILPLFSSIIIYGIAFIYGLFGLKSKTKKWKAYVGLLGWLSLVLLFIIETGSSGGSDSSGE